MLLCVYNTLSKKLMPNRSKSKNDFKSQNRNKKFPIVAVDVAIFSIKNNKLQVLLIKMKKVFFKNKWALPGGIVPIDKNIDQAAMSELSQKTGVSDVYLEQLYSFGDVSRDPFRRVVSVAYYALINSSGIRLKTTSKYGGVGWFPVKGCPDLAYDHDVILKKAIDRLKSKFAYSNVVYGLLSKKFTLFELQQVYEIILEKKLDKRNFRKKILSLGLIREVGIKKGESHRPAKIYAFTKRKLQFL